MAHNNLAVFVPHAGCPHRCSFCDQHTISGGTGIPTPDEVRATVKGAMKTVFCPAETEFAYFGGSFTAIPQHRMLSLLEVGQALVQEYGLKGIRISTRPDAVDDTVLAALTHYGVTAIELGAQSMSDEVLSRNRRGHTAMQVKDAAKRIRKAGFSLGLQMMVGLYGADAESDLETAKQLIALSPDTVRIYPTVILKNTLLEKLYLSGEYRPMDFEECVSLCARLLLMFEEAGIRVIRLGLQETAGMKEQVVGGFYHPAFRELCENRIYRDRALELLQGSRLAKAELLVAPRAISKMVGQKRSNLSFLREQGYDCRVLPQEGLSLYEIQIKDVRNCY